MSDDTLHVVMVRERKGNTPDCFRLYACRDKEPHCATQRKLNPSRACSSCVMGDESETLEQLVTRMQRGNA